MNKILIGVLSTAAAIVLSGCATTANTAKTPDAAVDAFLRDYVGVQFGDDISKIKGFEDECYMIPMKKNFHYFTKAACYYRKGKLYRVQIMADIGTEYSQNSTDAQLKKSMAAFAQMIGLPESYFSSHYLNYGNGPLWNTPRGEQPTIEGLSYIVDNATAMLTRTMRRYAIGFIDAKLDQETKSNKSAAPQYKPATDEIRKSWGLPLPDVD